MGTSLTPNVYKLRGNDEKVCEGQLQDSQSSLKNQENAKQTHQLGAMSEEQWRNFDDSAVQFSSVQDGIYALEKSHMRSTPSLRSFPKVAFQKKFQCSSDWPDSTPLSLQGMKKIVGRFLTLSTTIFPPCDRWCGVLSFVPVGSVSSSSTLPIFLDASHLWWLLCRVILSLRQPLIRSASHNNTQDVYRVSSFFFHLQYFHSCNFRVNKNNSNKPIS